MHKGIPKRVGRVSIKANIETVVADRCPRYKSLQQMVRNANGVLGEGFIGIPMTAKERVKILNDLFGKGRW